MAARKKKLTLSVDERVIEKARRYSARNETSISQLVSDYLDQLGEPAEAPVPVWVDRLLGVLPDHASVEEYRRHLEEKHG